MDDTTRRRFLKTAGATGVALAAGPALARGQGGGKTTLALVGCAHIHVPGFTKQLAERADVRVKWAWDPDPARVAKWGAAVGARTASSAGRDPRPTPRCRASSSSPRRIATASSWRRR